MRSVLISCLLWTGALVVLSTPGWAQDHSSDTTDRDSIERLTRVETRLDEGLKRLEDSITQLREDLSLQNQQLREDMQQLREDLSLQNQQLREDMQQLRADMNKQNEQLHDRLGNFMLLFTSIISVIGVILASIIGFTGRERKEARTERSELADIRAVLHALAQRDENVAAALKQFNL